MKLNRLVIPIVLLFALAFAANAADSINIINGSISLSGKPGLPLYSSFTLNNTGTSTLSVSFSNLVLKDGSGNSFSIDTLSTISMDNGSIQIKPFQTTIPSNQKAGIYTVSLNATGTNGTGGSAWDLVPVTVTVLPRDDSPEVSVSCGTLAYARGVPSSTEIKVNAVNTGNLDISGPVSFIAGQLKQNNEGYSNTILTPSVSLNYGETKEITVQISGLAGNTSIGTYTGQFNASYSNGTGTEVRSCTMTLTVSEPIYSLEVPGSVTFPYTSQNSTTSTTFTIRNNGNRPLQNVVLQSTADAKYQMTFNQTSFGTINVGSSKDVKVNVYIPADNNAGVYSVGTIYINGTKDDGSMISGGFSTNVNVKGKLNFKGIDVVVDSSTDSDVANGETISKNAKPASKVSFKIELENTFTNNEDVKIEDIFARVRIRDIDDGSDLEEESDTFDIEADDTNTVTLVFEIPQKVDQDTYEVQIHAEGQDENGRDHNLDWTVYLTVDKTKHDVIISTASLGSTSVQKGDSTTLHVTVLNIGEEDEDKVVLEIISDSLGINERQTGIELDKSPFDDDAEYDKFLSIDAPSKTGSYDIIIKVYYDDDKLDDQKTVTMQVTEGTTDGTTDDGTDDTGTDGTTDDGNDDGSDGGFTDGGSSDEDEVVLNDNDGNYVTQSGMAPDVTVTDTSKMTVTSSPLYLALLALGNLLVILLIIVVLVFAFSKPKKPSVKLQRY